MSTALATLTSNFASRFGLGDNQKELMETLKATAFKGQVTDAQMTALMLVAEQYKLNPWTREIYAFPDKNNGIVPVVGVDGWSRIINEHPQFDGMEFEQDDDSCTCVIYRKDRAHPVRVTEYMAECTRENAQPWKTHPRRMLRHKALIQCARLAFGFVGIYDQDEAERIAEVTVIDASTGEVLNKTTNGKPVVQPPQRKSETQGAATGDKITEGQRKLVWAKSNAKGLKEAALKELLGLESLNDILKADLDGVLKMIEGWQSGPVEAAVDGELPLPQDGEIGF